MIIFKQAWLALIKLWFINIKWTFLFRKTTYSRPLEVKLFAKASSFQKAAVHCTRISRGCFALGAPDCLECGLWAEIPLASWLFREQGLGFATGQTRCPTPGFPGRPREGEHQGILAEGGQSRDRVGKDKEMRCVVCFIHHTSLSLGNTNGACQNLWLLHWGACFRSAVQDPHLSDRWPKWQSYRQFAVLLLYGHKNQRGLLGHQIHYPAMIASAPHGSFHIFIKSHLNTRLRDFRSLECFPLGGLLFFWCCSCWEAFPSPCYS